MPFSLKRVDFPERLTPLRKRISPEVALLTVSSSSSKRMTVAGKDVSQSF